MGIRPGDKSLTWTERFWSRVDKTPGCWIWNGGTGGKASTPYGIWNTPTGRTSAHRVAWILQHGHLFDDQVIDHLCGNTLCVNPAHLEPVSAAENRRRQKERHTHCKRGHSLSGANLYVDRRGHRSCRICRNTRVQRFTPDQRETHLRRHAEYMRNRRCA